MFTTWLNSVTNLGTSLMFYNFISFQNLARTYYKTLIFYEWKWDVESKGM